MSFNAELIKVRYIGGHSLQCLFADGALKDVDLNMLLERKDFIALRQTYFFKQFWFDDFNVYWVNGAVINSGFLYRNGKPTDGWVCPGDD